MGHITTKRLAGARIDRDIVSTDSSQDASCINGSPGKGSITINGADAEETEGRMVGREQNRKDILLILRIGWLADDYYFHEREFEIFFFAWKHIHRGLSCGVMCQFLGRDRRGSELVMLTMAVPGSQSSQRGVVVDGDIWWQDGFEMRFASRLVGAWSTVPREGVVV